MTNKGIPQGSVKNIYNKCSLFWHFHLILLKFLRCIQEKDQEDRLADDPVCQRLHLC